MALDDDQDQLFTLIEDHGHLWRGGVERLYDVARLLEYFDDEERPAVLLFAKAMWWAEIECRSPYRH